MGLRGARRRAGLICRRLPPNASPASASAASCDHYDPAARKSLPAAGGISETAESVPAPG